MPREGLEIRDSWSEYRRLVTEGLVNLDKDLKELSEKFDDRTDEMNKKLEDMRLKFTVEITTLKVQASLWGGIAAIVVSIVTTFVVEKLLR